MGRYNRGYDALGEPITLLPEKRVRSGVSDGDVMARIEREIEDVCAQEDAFGVEEERQNAGKGETMMHDIAIARLRTMVAAAESGDATAIKAVVTAAAATDLRDAVHMVLPEIRHSLSAGDGRFTTSQVEVLEDALSRARGKDIAEAA